MLVLKPLDDVDFSQDHVFAARQVLKYFPPDVTLLYNVCPTKQMKGFFRNHMGFDHIIDEVVTAWGMLAYSQAEESQAVSG